MLPLLHQLWEVCLFGHVMGSGCKAHQKFEWGHSCSGARPGIVDILHQWELLCPVILLEVSIDAQVLF
jgi:hypothetical protein